MKRPKFLAGFLALVLVIASWHPAFDRAQAQRDEPYIPSGILVSELGDEVPPGRLNVRFPPRDPVQAGDAVRRLLQQPDSTVGGPVSAQAVPRITAEIQTLATGLENDPLAIYDYVYNHLNYIPSWGLLKNPRETLLAGAGNAFDQAALLSALLEAAGFQTRYVWGNIRVSKTAAMNWVGATDPAVVGDVFASGGIPTTDEGSTLRLTHIWVEVFDGGTWHSLDPSFRTYSEQAEQDLRPLMGYDLPTFIDDAEDGATITPDYVQNLNQTNIRDDLATYALNLVNYLRDHDTFIYPEELIGGRQIERIQSTAYPPSLPYTVVENLGQANDIPDDFAYVLNVRLPGIDYTVNVDDIAGERITVFYECATPADCQRLEDGGGVYNVYPAYEVHMVPRLRIGGTVVATGDAVQLGSWGHRLDATIATPISGWSPSFFQYLTAGEWYALPMRLQTVSSRALSRHVDLLNEAMSQGLDPDDERVLGQILYLLGLSYFNEVGLGDRIDARLAEVVHIPHLAMMIASRNLIVWVDYLQRPVMLDPASHTVDVRLNVASAISAENPADAARERAWFFSAGMRGSAAEHAIIEQLRTVPAISTVQILDRAIEEGQRIYYITPDNKDVIIPLLGHSYYILDSIDDYVSAGWHVVISQDPITYGQWHGSGWIVLDPGSGSAGYLISGYLGSTTAAAPLTIGGGGGVEQERLATPQQRRESNEKVTLLMAEMDYNRDGGRVVTREMHTPDPIDTVTGGFLYHQQDLVSLGGLGIPLGFERSYASSRHNLVSSLGYGWSHTYNTRFYTSADWVRGFGGRTALEAAPALATAQVGLDLFDVPMTMIVPHPRFPIDVTVVQWLMTQITGNAATLIETDGTVAAHVRLSDDAYQPPAGGGNLDVVTIAGDGSATLDWEDGTRMYFNADGHPVALDDANGNRTTLSYDAHDRLNRVSDAVGRSLTFTYDAQGRLVQISDPSGRSFGYSYDDQGNLQTYADPAGGVTTYTYDVDHDLTTITDPLGTIYATNQYNALGWVEVQTNGRGDQTSLLYGGDHTIVTGPMGYRTTYPYDERSRLLGVEDALGNRMSTAYDAADHETSRTNRLGQTITFAYDAWGRPNTTTDSLGHSTTWTYNAAGDPVSLTDQRGKTWQFTYDGQHNLTTVTDPLGATTQYTYNTKGQLIAAQDPAGVSVTYTYDTHGNLDCITNALSEDSCWSYDIVGRAVSFTDGTGHTAQFSYDPTGRLIRVVDPLGHPISYTYDANGNLTGFTDANGHTTTFTYDAQFNLTRVTDAMGGVTAYDYDANDGLVRVIDANGRETTYERDSVGRLTAITDPLGRAVTFTYDDTDRVVAFGRADGSSIGYQRDALGRPTGIDHPTGPDITYSYDAAGNLTSAAYGSDWSASYEYDDVGRLSRVEDGSRNVTLTHTYDPAGRRTGLRVDRDATALYDLAYSYDAAARLSTLADRTGSPATAVGFSYDAAGRTDRITDPGGAHADYTYDAAGRLTQVRHQDSQGQDIAAYTYTYDAAGNPTTVDETTPAGALATTYIYDALDRLTVETYPRYTIEYTYDPVGNLIRQIDSLGTLDYIYDAADQLRSRGSESFDYDQNGNLITWQDARGIYNYTYDHANRLIGLTLPDGTALAFTYDAFGRRVTAQGPTGARGFLHDGLDIILEYDGDLDQAIARYLYGNGLLVGRQTAQLGFTAYSGDGLENVRYLVDGSGQPFDAYRYDAYGRPAQAAGVDPNPFRFIGQRSVYRHSVLGWPALLMGYRYYDPGGGRFLTQDPWPGDLLYPQSLNDYVYALDNPVRYNDPTGLRNEPPVKVSPENPTEAAKPSVAKRGQVLLIPPTVALLPPGPPKPRAVPPAPVSPPVADQPPSGLSKQGPSSPAVVGSVAASQPPASRYSQRAFLPYYLDWYDRLWWLLWNWIESPMSRYDTRLGATSLEAGSVRWLAIADHGSTYALACTAEDRLLAGAFHAGLFRSTDAGHAIWNDVYTASVGEIAVVDSDTYYAGTWYSGALKSSDGGDSWSPVNSGLTANDVYALTADPAAPNRLFAGTEMGLFVSGDGGASWGRPAGSLPGRLVSDLAFAGDVLLAVTDLGLHRSDDSGASWGTPTVDLPLVRINVLLTGSLTGTVYAGTALGPYKSTDSGDTWAPWGTGLADADVHALAIDPADPSRVVAGTTAGLFASMDSGDTWTADTTEGLGGIASQVGALAFCPNGGDANMYLGTGGGVYALRTSVAPVSVTITGPAAGVVQTDYTFAAAVGPVTATLPLTYVWEVTGQEPVTNTGVNSLTDTVSFSWSTPGRKVITVTVSNRVGVTSTAQTVIISLQGPTGLSIDGLTAGVVGASYTFTATVNPVTATLPLTYVWEATGQELVVKTGVNGLIDVVSFAWSKQGDKVITATASNSANTTTIAHTINITGTGSFTFLLPLILHNHVTAPDRVVGNIVVNSSSR
jgi:RHS repeat-associated protein